MDKHGVPFLIGAVNLPRPERWLSPTLGFRRDQDTGLFFEGLLAVPPRTRLRKQTVLDHFTRYDHLYRRGGGIARIGVQSVPIPDVGTAQWHCFKTVVRGGLSLDEALIALPQVMPVYAY
ncbi:hypothetical protein ACRBEV_10975 [Methylobacterium phyllosphaerae]